MRYAASMQPELQRSTGRGHAAATPRGGLVTRACGLLLALAPACGDGPTADPPAAPSDPMPPAAGAGPEAAGQAAGQAGRVQGLDAATSGDPAGPRAGAGEDAAAVGRLPDFGRLDPLASARELRDPRADDWTVEERDALVHGLFEDLFAGLPIEERVASDFTAPALVPATRTTSTAAFEVSRGTGFDRTRGAGAEGLVSAWGELAEPGQPGPRARAKLKVIGVEASEPAAGSTGFAARLRVELVRPGGAEQVVTHWRTTWSRADDSEDRAPLLTGLEVLDFTRSRAVGGGPLFTDATRAVLGDDPAFARQLDVDLERWTANLDGALGASIIGHEGFALGDADGDGLDDLYVCQTGGLPNLLFLRRADGTAEEVGRAAGVDWLDASRSALFVDLDRDGDQDLVVEADPELLLMRNRGDGRFELAGSARAPATTSLSAADADGDGDLDLYACAYMLPDSSERVPLPYHDANNGRRNTFLLNAIEPPQDAGTDAPWVFLDATHEAGLDANNRRFSFAAAWEDYDGDGDQDLYVANDFGRNNLYRNDTEPGGPPRFVDVAAEAGVEDMAAGMGVSWGDVDGDGRPDLYVSNMFSSAGGRITYERRFRAASDEGERASYRRHARGNSLFRNRGDGTFEDVSEARGVTMGRWSWGALFSDFENDGWLDLVVPNGFVTGSDPLDL